MRLCHPDAAVSIMRIALQSLGVSKHIIYMREADIPGLLLANPRVRIWTCGQMLLANHRVEIWTCGWMRCCACVDIAT